MKNWNSFSSGDRGCGFCWNRNPSSTLVHGRNYDEEKKKRELELANLKVIKEWDEPPFHCMKYNDGTLRRVRIG